MAELMDPEGPWSMPMLELGLGEALVIETKRKKASFESVGAAIGSAFSKGEVGKAYNDALEKMLALVDNRRRNRRGTEAKAAQSGDVEGLRRAFGSARRRKK